jgi:hypothetical protein
MPCPEGLYRIGPQRGGRAWEAAGASGQTSQSNTSIVVRATPTGNGNRTVLPELQVENGDESADEPQRPKVVAMRHNLGYSMPGMLRRVVLRNSLDEPTVVALVFYPVERLEALPHEEVGESAEIERSQNDMEDRLEAASHH